MSNLLERVAENKFLFKLKNNKVEIAKLESIIEQLSQQWDLGFKVAFNMNLVIEEAISNIIIHGNNDCDDEILIETTLEVKENQIEVTIADNSRKFNPLEHKSDPKEDDLDKLQIGGLGIHFIKQLTQSQSYRRVGKRNILTFDILRYE